MPFIWHIALLLNNYQLFSMLKRLSTKGRTGKSLGKIRVDFLVLYSSSQTKWNWLYLLVATLSKIRQGAPRSTHTPFSLQHFLHLCSCTSFTSNLLLMYSLLPVIIVGEAAGPAQLLLHPHLFIFNNMGWFDYDPRDFDKRWEQNATKGENFVLCLVSNSFES